MMKPLELALKFMDIFFRTRNLEELEGILSEDFYFKGPLYEFTSALSYIESLKSDPPEDCEYDLIHSFESSASAALFYVFSKPGIEVAMAQLFEIQDDKIKKIWLIFDSKPFS